MMNGIWFDDIHSYEDLNLVLSEVNIPPAKPKTNYVDIPGGDGSIDLTETLGEVKYHDRECTFTFTVFPHEDFEEKKREVSNLLNGKRFRIIVDKDPDYYWTGRCSINEYASSKMDHKIVVGAIVAPYKLKVEVTKVVVPRGEDVFVRLRNARKTVIPIVTVRSTSAILKWKDISFNLATGSGKIAGFKLGEGYHELLVTSTLGVTIEYQEGDL